MKKENKSEPKKQNELKQYKPIFFKQHPSIVNKNIKQNNNQTEESKQLDCNLELNSINSSPIKCPRNINIYRHLLQENGMLNTDVAWSFSLRSYIKNKMTNMSLKHSKLTETSPPSFYNADLKKFMSTKMKKCVSLIEMKNNTNWNNYNHLTKDSFEKYTNPSLIQFSTTLRSFSKPSYVNPNEWKRNQGKRPQSSYPISKRMEYKDTLKRIDKYVLRPYIEVTDKAFVGEETIKRKKLVPNKAMISEFEGYHLSFSPYTNEFNDKNIAPVRFIVEDRKRNNSQVFFELGLREYNHTIKNNKKIMFKPPIKLNKPKTATDSMKDIH